MSCFVLEDLLSRSANNQCFFPRANSCNSIIIPLHNLQLLGVALVATNYSFALPQTTRTSLLAFLNYTNYAYPFLVQSSCV